MENKPFKKVIDHLINGNNYPKPNNYNGVVEIHLHPSLVKPYKNLVAKAKNENNR